MLQPEKYPNLIGEALVFEPEPFVVMADDDNPWVEGLFFTIVIGLVVAVAQVVGGVLMTASLPNQAAFLETLLRFVRQMETAGFTPVEISALEDAVRQWWPILTGFSRYGVVWPRLLLLIVLPLWLVVQWLAYGLLSHGVAKGLGGTGTLNQTLGVTALSMAPRIFLLATLIPFASVGAWMLHIWGLLIAYRGLEVAHDLGVRKAMTAALVPLLILAVISSIIATLVASSILWLGGVP